MISPAPGAPAHGYGHLHDHGHAHHHAHAPASPHPAQPAPWSILRMAALSRLAAAAGVIAALWAVVWLAMR
jgi:hypothetical protein